MSVTSSPHRDRQMQPLIGRLCLAAILCCAASLAGCQGIQSWLRIDGTDSQVLRGGEELDSAIQDYQSGNIQGALDATRRAREADPTLSASYELEALMQADLGNQPEHIAALRNAIASHPKSPKLQSAAGRMLIDAGEREEGLAAMQRAVRLAPRDTAYARDLAGIYLEAGDLTTAAAVLTAAQIQNPHDPSLPVVLARLCETAGDWQGAAEHYQLVLQREPKNAVWRRQQAKCLYRLQQFPQSAAEFQRCLETDVAALTVPDRVEFGDACLRSGDFKRAEWVFDELVEDGYETRDVAVLRGVCALQREEPQRAEQIFTDALARWPDDPKLGLLLNSSRQTQSTVMPVVAEVETGWMPPVTSRE
jgi:tetratricopeptide (TPR) repeat protein